jgi:geranylgeranyl pyrophosphate synthase
MDKLGLQQSVPHNPTVRLQIRQATKQWVHNESLLPPLARDSLQSHAHRCLETMQLDAAYLYYTMIMLNNALWEDYFSHIPYDQRLLLLPICLRDHEKCQAPRDELGLLCQECGACHIPEITEKAEQLGYSVLVAESSSSVSQWVKCGEIQGIVGVSCLHSLEKAFPSMLRHAVPGIAIPLLTDGCKNSQYDTLALNQAIEIPQADRLYTNPGPMIKQHVNELFTPNRIAPYLNVSTPALKQFPKLAASTLCDNGKHHRPVITFGTYCSLLNHSEFPDFLEPIAIAVECFHKASLIHDDIEDADDTRYDKPTLHKQVGLPIALNLGDFLIGQGYRLLSHQTIPYEIRALLNAQAAQAHCELALGQAQEFELLGKDTSFEQCLQTHLLKTAPAFRVAMYFGAIAARKFEPYEQTLYTLSNALGVAYQLLDDLQDMDENPASAIDTLMRAQKMDRPTARDAITELYKTYQRNAYAALEGLDDPVLKIFLYRLCGRILEDV